ncbi:MAG: exo-alpha-sialidase [Clostridia bacterium]|nr:exo-alpha-sialidase [Clostridia bacterium]
MKKYLSLLSFILVCSMLMGMLPLFAVAAESEGDDIINAYYSTSYDLDGSAEEEPLNTSGLISLGGVSIGALWNNEAILLYIDGASDEDVSIELSGYEVDISAGAMPSGIDGVSWSDGELLEVMISIDITDIEVSEFEQEIPMTLSVGGEEIFDGHVRFSSASFDVLSYNAFNLTGKAADQSISKESSLDFYAPKDKAGRAYIICEKNNILSNHEGVGVLEMSIDARAIPVLYDGTITEKLVDECARICDGLAVGVNYNVPGGKGFTFNLTNIKDMGLCLVLSLDDEKAVTLPLGRKSGDSFRLRFEYDFEGALVDIYADTDYIGQVDDLLADGFWGNNTVNQLTFNMWSDRMPSEFDVSISNILVGNYYEPNIISYFIEDYILGENSSLKNVIKDLDLKKEFFCEYMNVGIPVTYRSSNEAILDPVTGKVNRPDEGVENLTLTVIIDGKEKDLDVFVIGKNELFYRYLVVENDIDTANGVAVEYDELMFCLDKSNNSVVIDLGVITPFNSVRLYDSDDICRLNAESVTLWVSANNKNYTQIKDFKFLRDGKFTYLYGFEAKGCYVKVHYTHFDDKDSDFYAPLAGMILPKYEKVFGVGDKVLSQNPVTVTNGSDSPIRDGVFELSLKTIGVSGDSASIRVFCGDELLYHYTEGDSLFVRIPVLDAGESVEITVMFGAEGALDISNKESVYEVNYGTRESFISNGDHRWLFKIPKGTKFPNGDVSEKEVLISWTNTIIYGSYDGGSSWFKYGKVQNGLNSQLDGTGDYYSGGFIFDDETGRIFYETHCYRGFNGSDMSKSDCVNKVLYSDDGGKNWKMADVLEPDTVNGKTFNYMLSYSDGIKLSSYDGKGPNIDFVFPTGAQFNNKGAFCARVAYSSDGGFTWQYSKSLLIYGDGSSFEGGMSEAYILENEDGVLVLYCRCQFNYVDRFAMAYSYDNGLTWTPEKTKEAWVAKKGSASNEVSCLLSTVYATNTQPVMFKYDGTPIFLWGGNNALNAGSYIRNPLNLAVSYDGLETWENIQNLFSETPHETYLGTHYITNPSAQKIGEDGLVVTFDRLIVHNDMMTMKVSDLTKFLYLTKGAYDSFESATPRYEGWITYRGGASLSTARAKSGARSMFIAQNSTISRSIPYFTKGEISFDIFAEIGTSATFELQPAFSKDSGKYAYLCLNIKDLELSVGGKKLALSEGWNTVTVNIGTGATISANGNRIIVGLNKAVDQYVCYAVFFTNSGVYVDDFKVLEGIDEKIYLNAESEEKVNDIYGRIKALGEISAEDEDEIKSIRAAYERLNVSEKLSVYNISSLEAAERSLDIDVPEDFPSDGDDTDTDKTPDGENDSNTGNEDDGDTPNGGDTSGGDVGDTSSGDEADISDGSEESDDEDNPDGSEESAGVGGSEGVKGCGCGSSIDGGAWMLVAMLAIAVCVVRKRRSQTM